MSDDENAPVLIQTNEGTATVLKSKRGGTRTVKLGREWRVELDGHEIGTIRYRMFTHQRRVPGMRNVSTQWQSPGWECTEPGSTYRSQETSKSAAIESLVWAARHNDGD
jgi:hypothetical protein